MLVNGSGDALMPRRSNALTAWLANAIAPVPPPARA